MKNFKHGSLLSGIGGFDLAAEWMGWENLFHCEWNPFGQSVLKHYWPNAESFNDITKTDFTKYANTIDILTGGFPCQPYSTAGKRLGKEDERHLWPHMLRAIREIQPRWVVGENVSGLISWNGGMVFDEVQAELEAEGYEVIPFVLPAAGVNAPHRRDRVWFVARNAKHDGRDSTEIGGPDNQSPFPSRANQVGESAGADSVQSALDTRSTSDTQSFGTGEDFGRIRSLPDGYSDGIQRRPTPNPDNKGECDGLRAVQREDEEIPQRNNNAEPGDADTRATQNPNSNGRGGDEREKEPGIREQRNTGAGDNERVPADHGEAWAITDSKSERREPFIPRTEEFLPPEGQVLHGRSGDGFGEVPTWENFPTVSPLCSGDDGFSDILDADTLPKDKNGKSPRSPYSKWRNESIKAGGNAIVPQVALQIFKAIELFETELFFL